MKDDGAASRATPAKFRLLGVDEIMRIYRGLQPSNVALVEEARHRYSRIMEGTMGFEDDEVADAPNADLVCAVAARLEFVEAALLTEIERLEHLALEDDCYRCDKCERVFYVDDMGVTVFPGDDHEQLCKVCYGPSLPAGTPEGRTNESPIIEDK